jgi:hypothetical protein
MESRRNVSASKHIPSERLGSGERGHDRDGAFGALPGIGGAQLREWAKTETNEEARLGLLDMARQYDQLAGDGPGNRKPRG